MLFEFSAMADDHTTIYGVIESDNRSNAAAAVSEFVSKTAFIDLGFIINLSELKLTPNTPCVIATTTSHVLFSMGTPRSIK